MQYNCRLKHQHCRREHRDLEVKWNENIEFWIIEYGLCLSGGTFCPARGDAECTFPMCQLWREGIESIHSLGKSLGCLGVSIEPFCPIDQRNITYSLGIDLKGLPCILFCYSDFQRHFPYSIQLNTF